jgi:hypothetical protein
VRDGQRNVFCSTTARGSGTNEANFVLDVAKIHRTKRSASSSSHIFRILKCADRTRLRDVRGFEANSGSSFSSAQFRSNCASRDFLG